MTIKTPTNQKGEMRQDLVTGKWVAIATGRAKRPDDFQQHSTPEATKPAHYKDDCPFCNPAKFPQETDVLKLPNNDNWQVRIFPNKYPAFVPGNDLKTWNHGPYRSVTGLGYHELLAPKKHSQIEGLMSEKDFSWQLEALVLRYRHLKALPHVNHIQIIKNHGREAGGSVEHPHHQIFAIPVLPSDILDMLDGSEQYARNNNGHSAYTDILTYERENRHRLIVENDLFSAFCPYASRVPFEVCIMPRQASPFFEDMGPVEREALAEIMRPVFAKLYHGLNNPPYNYNIYSAPCDEHGFVCNNETFSNFRWHIQIMPRLNTWGGFEMSTGLEINTVLPEEAAEFLRDQPT